MKNGKLIAALVLMVLAVVIGVMSTGALKARPGKNVEVVYTCPKCAHVQDLTMDVVIAKGTMSSQTGWYMPCEKCATLAPVHKPGQQPATISADP